MRAFLRYQLPPLLWILVIFIFSYFSDRFVNTKIPLGTDKIVHAVLYFVLCWLVQRAFYQQTALLELKKSSFLGAFIFCVVYGMLDEFHHGFLSGQSSNIYNVFAGTGGALLYIAISSIVSRRNNGSKAERQG